MFSGKETEQTKKSPQMSILGQLGDDLACEPKCKKPKLDQHANDMKVAFSLSAIEEMKQRVDEDNNIEKLDKQLRQFQVIDEVGSNSEEDDGK